MDCEKCGRRLAKKHIAKKAADFYYLYCPSSCKVPVKKITKDEFLNYKNLKALKRDSRKENPLCPTCNQPICWYKGRTGNIFSCTKCKKTISKSSLLNVSEYKVRSMGIHKGKLRGDNTTGYRGVSFNKKLGKYIGNIQINGSLHYLGLYQTAEDAALAYNAKAIEFYGPNAFQNKIVSDRSPHEYEYGVKGFVPLQ